MLTYILGCKLDEQVKVYRRGITCMMDSNIGSLRVQGEANFICARDLLKHVSSHSLLVCDSRAMFHVVSLGGLSLRHLEPDSG